MYRLKKTWYGDDERVLGNCEDCGGVLNPEGMIRRVLKIDADTFDQFIHKLGYKVGSYRVKGIGETTQETVVVSTNLYATRGSLANSLISTDNIWISND